LPGRRPLFFNPEVKSVERSRQLVLTGVYAVTPTGWEGGGCTYLGGREAGIPWWVVGRHIAQGTPLFSACLSY